MQRTEENNGPLLPHCSFAIPSTPQNNFSACSASWQVAIAAASSIFVYLSASVRRPPLRHRSPSVRPSQTSLSSFNLAYFSLPRAVCVRPWERADERPAASSPSNGSVEWRARTARVRAFVRVLTAREKREEDRIDREQVGKEVTDR